MLMCESCLAYHLGNHYPRMVVLHIEIRDLRENTLIVTGYIQPHIPSPTLIRLYVENIIIPTSGTWKRYFDGNFSNKNVVNIVR